MQGLTAFGQVVEATSKPMFSMEYSVQEEPLHILHVDDDASILSVSKMILETENKFEIDTATSVDEAFSKLKTHVYDAVVSDYEMPLKNGLDFLKELREQKNNIAFIIFTGRGREEVAVKALNLGADRYIDKNGSPETVYCELADAINKTVEHKKSRDLLTKSESKYRALVENSLQGISILLSAPIRIVFANGAFGKLLGYSSQELTSLSPEGIMSLVYQEDRATFFKLVEKRLRGESAEACFEFRAVRKDGSVIWLSALSNRVEYEGQPAVQGMFLDVNENKKAAEILCESEQRYRELANCLPDIVFETDINGRIVFANERAPEISGYSQEELEKGLNIMQFIAPEDWGKAEKNIQRLLAGGSYVPAEYAFVRKDGSTFPALITATPRISENKVTGLRGLVLDITERKKAEQAVNASLKRYQSFIEVTGELGWITNAAGEVSEDTPSFRNFTGQTYDEVKGWGWTKAVHPDDLEHATRAWKAAIAAKTKYEVEYRLRRCDGVYRNFMARGAPILEEDGKIREWIGTCIDITERNKAEKTLRESEEKLRTMFEGASDGILAADPKTKSFVFANPRICEITGYSLKELLKLNVSDIHPEKDLLSVTDQFTKQAQGKITLAMDVPVLRKDREVVYCDINSRSAKIGEQEYLVGFFRDITERKKAEEGLRESEESFRSLIDSMDDLVFVLGFDGIFKNYHQPSHNKELYAAPEEFVGKHFLDVLPPQVSELCQAAMKRIEDSGETQEFDYYLEMNGEKSWYNARLSPTKDQSGRKTSVTIVVRNITERKEVEKALLQSETKFRMYVENSPVAIFVADSEGKYEYANEAASKLLGYSAKELKGMSISQIVFAEEQPATLSSLAAVQKNGNVFGERRLKKKGDQAVYVSLNAVKLPNGKLIAFCEEITERKKAEESLKESEEKFRSLAEESPNMIFINLQGRVVYANKKCVESMGYSKEEFYSPDFNFLSIIAPEYVEVLKSSYSMHMRGENVPPYEYVLVARDGKRIEAIITSKLIEYGGEKAILGIVTDITERKKAEKKLNQMMDQLVLVNEKLGVVGSLSRHDVRNKLSAVTGYAYLLEKKHADQADILDGISKMKQAINEIGRIFDFAKIYEQLGIEELTYIGVEKTLKEAISLFSGSLSLEVINDCHGLTLLADSLLRQLFYNLIDNSLKHGEKVSKIRVYYEKVDEDKLIVVYEDNGIGISAENKPHLFKEGFSTSGTSGYGLFLIRKMMEVYGWAIEENGVPGKGARFIITIPRTSQSGKESFQFTS